jgi:hypothetical protein
VIGIGDKVHVVPRRLFNGDIRRHFVGEVATVSGDLSELRGYTFVFQARMNEFRRLPELRTRLLSLREAGHIFNKIPRGVEVGLLFYQVVDRRLVVTEGQAVSLPINEFGPTS